ncbi:MAG: alanine--tRNA ligase [Patescibacteria group bacterium]
MQSPLTSADIRSRFLAFFEKRGHTIIPSASLVTPDEKGITNATLFNTAGMQPLVPYLLGKPYVVEDREIVRLADSQKCVRTVDIDDIGDKTHATFFEMLGNWSLGDYFKKEAIEWSYEFLTSKEEGLGLNPDRLYVSVFEGDANAPRDDEAATIWREILTKNKIEVGGDTTAGEKGRIFYLPAKNNWWEAGDNGPCGPDTEMFYDISNTFQGGLLTHTEYVAADDSRDIVEVWNDVFMQYEKKDGKIVGTLPKPSVDTGAGLERLTMTIQGVDNIYDTDLLKPVMDLMKNPDQTLRNKRIIADHLRASTFLIADGVTPSNTDRGYILRRLIRRAIVNTTDKKLDSDRISAYIDTLATIYKSAYPELLKNSEYIKKVLTEESAKFAEALVHGIKEFERISKTNAISGADAFMLFSSFGLPIDVTRELAKEKNLSVDLAGFEAEFKKHQDLSRAGAEQKFKGGLADANDPMVVRYHTATHLLHQALHDVLGENEGNQKGSNITAERLRFDFTGVKLTDDQKKRVEDIVNEKITADLPMNNVVLPRAEAEKTGARHFFGEKYGDEISIYFIGGDLASAYSKEFCGGPHVKNTGELAGPEGKWRFKIQKEEAVSQGVRRIKAVLG